MMIDENAAIRVLAELSRESHLTSEALRQFLTDPLGSAESTARVKLHLSNCEECQEALADEAASLQKESEPEAEIASASCEERLLQTLPTLTALLQGRQQHMEELGKLVMPEKKHWMLPSLLKTIARTPEDRESEKRPVEQLRAAAFSEADRKGAPQYLKDIVRVVDFVTEMEDALVSRWNEVQLNESALAALLDECIRTSPAAHEWPPGLIASVQSHYVRVLLPITQ